jgi:hypothetical protein
LNNTQVGGKRRNPWYHELWNIKYLKNFRWTHLNERLAYEQEIRKQRLRQEISLAKKETNYFIQNYEKSKICRYFLFLKLRNLKLRIKKSIQLFSKLLFKISQLENTFFQYFLTARS